MSAGGSQTVFGSAYATHVLSGDAEYVSSGGVDSASTIGKGGNEYITIGGVADYNSVASGGAQNVEAFGFAAHTTVSKGGTETILNDASEDYSNIYGAEVVSADGAATSDTVQSGGAQRVHGTAEDTTISSGGAEDVFSGGSADMSQVYGSAVVSSGGSGYGDTVHTGGLFTVSSGGSVSDGLTISGGYAGISGGVASGQEVLFVGHGDLALYDLSAFSATIGGYSTGDELDLGGFAFGAGETRSYASGTLTVVDGGKTATLSLVGSYVTSDFALSTDSHGGTFVKFV